MITGINKQAEKAQSREISSNRKRLSFLVAAILFFLGMTTISAQATSAATAASFVGVDSASQGNWQGKYGTDGYSISSSNQTLPFYASLSVQSQMNWTWSGSTSDVRALSTANGATRMASTWYQASSFVVDVNLTDGNAHQVAFYAVDWDGGQRSETVQVSDANSGAVLDTRSISNFGSGVYLVWNITGHARVTVNHTGGSNAVVSGVFFGGVAGAQKPAAASFVRSDVSTQGNWQGVYGSDGSVIAAGTQSIPAYGTFALQNQANWTWAASTTDNRALKVTSGRAAATWFNSASFSFNLNFTDGNTHSVAIYALDWDNQQRAETIRIVDANSNAVLSSQNISSFGAGMYLVYNISGSVKINVISTCGPNAVVSGVFFGSAATAAASQSTTTSTASQTSTPATNTAAPVTTAPTTTAPQAAPATYVLSASTSSVSFGKVTVANSSTQSVMLTNTGTGNVAISNVTVSGAGFNASGVSVGTIVTPGQTVTLNAVFTPAASGSATGKITISSNATSGANVISLSATGAAPVTHTVNLNWAPSTSSVVGYNVYVSSVSGSGYSKLTSSPVSTPDYADSSLQAAGTRYYVVTSLNSNNQESGYSEEVSAIIP